MLQLWFVLDDTALLNEVLKASSSTGEGKGHPFNKSHVAFDQLVAGHIVSMIPNALCQLDFSFPI